MVPRTDLAADLPAHPAPARMAQGQWRPRFANALGRHQSWPRGCGFPLGRPIRASFVHFPCTGIRSAHPRARRGRPAFSSHPAFPAHAGIQSSRHSSLRLWAPAFAGDMALCGETGPNPGHLTRNPNLKNRKHTPKRLHRRRWRYSIAISARSSGMPQPFSDEVIITNGWAAPCFFSLVSISVTSLSTSPLLSLSTLVSRIW